MEIVCSQKRVLPPSLHVKVGTHVRCWYHGETGSILGWSMVHGFQKRGCLKYLHDLTKKRVNNKQNLHGKGVIEQMSSSMGIHFHMKWWRWKKVHALCCSATTFSPTPPSIWLHSKLRPTYSLCPHLVSNDHSLTAGNMFQVGKVGLRIILPELSERIRRVRFMWVAQQLLNGANATMKMPSSNK